MNVCTREEAEARSNVEKFEPSHGWGSDRRPDETLTTGELLSLVAWLRERNARLSSGGCRFNCRTRKEHWQAGFMYRGGSHIRLEHAEKAYDEWKRKRATSAQDNKGGV